MPPRALIFVAFLMAKSLGAINWHDPTEYIPALIIALLMPLTYSIATGIGLGFIAYVVLKLVAGRYREIKPRSPSSPRLSCEVDLPPEASAFPL